METKLKCKVAMLPTKKATWPNCLWLGRISGQLRIDKSYNGEANASGEPYKLPPFDNSMLP